MYYILTIFKKEFKELLRDRRTLFAMIIFPLLIVPLMILPMTKIASSQSETAQFKHLKVAINDNGNGTELMKRLNRRKDLTLLKNIDPENYTQLIKDDSLDLALEIDPGFDKAIQDGKTGALKIHYNATSDTVVFTRLAKTIERYHDEILLERLGALGASRATIQPTRITATNIYSNRESIGKMAGGMLPYFFVLFALIGAMYPAIDLFTGEKERGTIETILTVPASRLHILLGKMLVIILAGTISGLLTIVGLFLALKINSEIPAVVTNMVSQLLHPTALFLVLSMILPLTTFFVGILIPISIYAKSFKEAQSLIQPVIVLIVLPLVVGTMPAIKLNILTAIIPVLNVALASREIVAGTIDYGLLAVVFISLFAFAAMSILVCIRWFGKEGNVLK